MSIYKGTTLLAGNPVIVPLFTTVWQDHILNDISWLRADTNYSWLCSITAADNYPKSVQATSFTTTGCTWKVASQGGTLTNDGFRWEAKGYLPSGS